MQAETRRLLRSIPEKPEELFKVAPTAVPMPEGLSELKKGWWGHGCARYECDWSISKCDNFEETDFDSEAPPCCVHLLRDLMRAITGVLITFTSLFCFFFLSVSIFLFL